MHDVVIVGAGPGGLYAADQLARRGFDVAVFEEHQSPGEPVHCTGVLALEAFSEFEIPRASILNPLRTARFFGPSGQSVDYTTPTVEAVVIDRRVFDAGLSEQAKSAGAVVTAGSRVVDLQVSGRTVRMAFDGQRTVEARACILACGASYTLQRRLGLGTPTLHLQSAQLEVPAAAPGDVELHFGCVAPKGFAWAVPVQRASGSYARVGLMCDRQARERFDDFLARIGERWRIDCGRGASLAPRTKILPLAPIAKTFGARLLAVGDAAGLVKATTGGGIYYSLLSADVAADVLAAALRNDRLDACALSAYEERWRALVGDELEAQRMLRTIADRLSDEDIEDLFVLARTDGIMPIVRRSAAFNRHRGLILSLIGHPPARRVLMRHMKKLVRRPAQRTQEHR